MSASMDKVGPNTVTPALGLTWANQVTCRIMMSRSAPFQLGEDPKPTHSRPGENGSSSSLPTHRELSVVFAPHLAPARLKVLIDDTGLHGVDDWLLLELSFMDDIIFWMSCKSKIYFYLCLHWHLFCWGFLLSLLLFFFKLNFKVIKVKTY